MALEHFIHGKRDDSAHVGKRSNVLREQAADYHLQTTLDDIQDVEWSRQMVKLLPADSLLRSWHQQRLDFWDKEFKK